MGIPEIRISMDSFKVNEVKRMEQGGNNAWKSFWEGHADGGKKDSGGGWNDLPLEEAIRERYSEETGEEYKERLSAKVDEREYVAVANRQKKSTSTTPRSATLPGGASPARSGSPAAGSLNPRKEKNEAYFAKLGNENMVRPAHLPPSQGGKYAGFGSEPPPTSTGVEAAMPGVDDFQKDPVAALTKGFGWFTSTVGKGAKTVNDGWIQPTAQKLAEADLATQARITAAQVAQNVQKGTKGAAEQFNRFVEGEGDPTSHKARSTEPEKKDFWDSFGVAGDDRTSSMSSTGGKSSAIGTAAMKSAGKDDAPDEDKWDKF
ncbi:Zn finger-containing GTPase- Activating Protein for ARF [Schaereria dolodes]|nr:Zn finger-containing GTPase- Activating Protein for ARF [Schaereria dolodes]